jgi:hypothetical protein
MAAVREAATALPGSDHHRWPWSDARRSHHRGLGRRFRAPLVEHPEVVGGHPGQARGRGPGPAAASNRQVRRGRPQRRQRCCPESVGHGSRHDLVAGCCRHAAWLQRCSPFRACPAEMRAMWSETAAEPWLRQQRSRPTGVSGEPDAALLGVARIGAGLAAGGSAGLARTPPWRPMPEPGEVKLRITAQGGGCRPRRLRPCWSRWRTEPFAAHRLGLFCRVFGAAVSRVRWPQRPGSGGPGEAAPARRNPGSGGILQAEAWGLN